MTSVRRTTARFPCGRTSVLRQLCALIFGLGAIADASAERILNTLPHTELFDSSAYTSDILWFTEGATHTYMSGAGWRGGAAKFTPPVTNQGYSGLGQFHLSGLQQIPAQLNVRFLIYHGNTWNLHGPGNKLIIMNRSGNDGRPMIITRHWNEMTSDRWETWGACDGTVCRYEGGDFFPDGSDRLRIGDPPGAREHEWVSVEFEANTVTGMIRLYVDTQDGDLQGLYIERPMDDTGAGGIWSYIDIIGGYMDFTTTPGPENYFMIDELVIASNYIGPPEGFLQCCFANGFE
jgi:hypothetical protein